MVPHSISLCRCDVCLFNNDCLVILWLERLVVSVWRRPQDTKGLQGDFLRFVALGCMVQLGPLLDISDAFVFLICVPNILGMYFLAPIVKRELDDYAARLKAGKIKKFKNV